MRITKKICVLMSWSLLMTTVLSGCTYYAALERETKREVTTKKELKEALQGNENQLRIRKKREMRLKELETQIAKIAGELDKLEGHKKEEECKINELYAKDKQLKKRKEDLLRKVKKEFEPKINRLTVKKKRKKKELSRLQQENTE